MALAPIARASATQCRQITWVEAVAPGPNDGNNAREWWTASEDDRARPGGRPAIGAFQPYEVGRTNRLRIQPRPTTSTCTPECTDNNLVFVKRVIQMAGDFAHVDTSKASDTRRRIGRPGPWQQCQDPDGVFKFGYEHVHVDSILNPPFLLTSNVSAGRRREPDSARDQRARSSRRISSASTSRPAATSASDWRRAS